MMKNPLNYQTTEFDCGPTSLMNAISYLFRREDIPPDIAKNIMLYSMDAYNEKGEFGKSGTSKMAMMFVSSWLNQFEKVKKFPIHCDYISGAEVGLTPNSKVVSSLQQGGAVVIRLMYGCWHYVLLTGLDNNFVFLFDPYFRKREFRAPGIQIVTNAPTKMNRKVAYEYFSNEGKGIYALGPKDTREAVILFNQQTRKTEFNTIEYFI